MNMKNIWAPWRIEYIRMEKPSGCILCDKPAQKTDVQNYILFRGKKNFIMLNAYPYSPGHLMVAPYRHIATPEELTDDESSEHIKLTALGIKVLKEAFSPTGFNTGMNIGKIAGAGVDGHIHTHIVPRWQGDTNFMTVVADIRVVSEALAETYNILKGKF
jgi:ATP adenylyltransferase